MQTLKHAASWLVLAWVAVMNPDGIRNMDHHFAFGDACLLTTMQGIQAIGQFDTGTLYRITESTTRRGTGSADGILCPTETLFFMHPDAFQRAQEEERAAMDEQERLRNDIRHFLHKGK